MSALPGRSGASRTPVGQINSKTAQQGVSNNESSPPAADWQNHHQINAPLEL